ncbi:unnamed protein product [Timema podura]|uniref:Serine/threonine-protein phosphatase n=1 Tax=Timema podura TaxID=61482 RepID=A0ABN7NGU0_TIMPD|nr:unnamed protein product [Timema podura]
MFSWVISINVGLFNHAMSSSYVIILNVGVLKKVMFFNRTFKIMSMVVKLTIRCHEFGHITNFTMDLNIRGDGLKNNELIRGARPGKNVQLTEGEIRGLCLKSREIFLSQPILLELEAPLKICGDIHGQYYDLLRLFEYGGFPPESNYLFLGDYVDRGKQSLETICLLLAYKIKYPENFFLLRGNHECASINRIYGKRRYNIKLWKTFTDCFNCLPVAAIVDEKIFCCHGGLSPDLQSMEQIRRIMRPTDVPDQGLLCDLLWSDPDKVVEDGYEFFAKRQLVTLFSAPNYCGEFDNAGAMMSVDETLMCSFQILKVTILYIQIV